MSYEYLIIGFLTTEKKARNREKQIGNLMERFEAFGEFKANILSDIFLNQTPIEEWPFFDILIPYHLDHFTIKRVEEYYKLRSPLLFNDLDFQEKLLSRKFIYETMKSSGIPCLSYRICDHVSRGKDSFVEGNDFIEINGDRMNKPFVEKPVSARRHDIHIYYSKSMGGGVRKLFRKTGNCSSKFFPGESRVRRDGVYIYERLIESQKDVKVYAVLQKYSYAETRKSPTLDGIVERNPEGYEIREYCPLTYEEANVAKKVIKTFKQNICGFDLIREDNNRFYVIDVNGMNFVKYNIKYFDDATHIIRTFFLAELKRLGHEFYTKRAESRIDAQINGIVDKQKGDVLLGVITLFRHGDRTTKQKAKINTNDAEIRAMFETTASKTKEKGAQVSFKSEADFERVLNALERILENGCLGGEAEHETHKAVSALKKKGPGTKVQLKQYSKEDGESGRINVICKWGGILTEKGRTQCIRYAESFKKVYRGLDNFENLTKTFRIYASDELRVKQSAKFFVDTLTGNKTRLTVQSNEDVECFLNLASMADHLRDNVKKRISLLMNKPKENSGLCGEKFSWIKRSYIRLQDPPFLLKQLLESVTDIIDKLKKYAVDHTKYVVNGETIFDIIERWKELKKSFYKKDEQFNVSSVCDINDSLKYDLNHNYGLFKSRREMHNILKKLCAFICPAEYGITDEEKMSISKIIIKELLLRFMTKLRLVRAGESEHKTFIFFASESMLHALRNFFLQSRFASNETVFENFEKTEFNYMSHVIIRLYEDTVKSIDDPKRFYINIMFSPGVWGDPFLHIDQRSFRKDKRELLNPLVDKMGFEEFCEVINSNLVINGALFYKG